MNAFPHPDARIGAISELGRQLAAFSAEGAQADESRMRRFAGLHDAAGKATAGNQWFTSENISFALQVWGETLTEKNISQWMSGYSLPNAAAEPKEVAGIMAGNIPLVGMHDFLCVLLAGHSFTGKLSADDAYLLPAVAALLVNIEPAFGPRIHFTSGMLDRFDAIIATGSNNTSRYFEHYFAHKPHIIRKNRNGVAVLSGNENALQLARLGDDICRYYGLGCRNVSKVFIPEGFDPAMLFQAVEPYASGLWQHNKYMNNYTYRRSVFLLNQVPHLDNGVMLLTESKNYSSPVAVLAYESYSDPAALQKQLEEDSDQIQCVAAEAFAGTNTIPFGSTQHPELWNYADGVDTMEFLIQLK